MRKTWTRQRTSLNFVKFRYLLINNFNPASIVSSEAAVSSSKTSAVSWETFSVLNFFRILSWRKEQIIRIEGILAFQVHENRRAYAQYLYQISNHIALKRNKNMYELRVSVMYTPCPYIAVSQFDQAWMNKMWVMTTFPASLTKFYIFQNSRSTSFLFGVSAGM